VPIGKVRMRMPVAAKITFINAGANGDPAGFAGAARRRVGCSRHNMDTAHQRNFGRLPLITMRGEWHP
jgi:hypothetical protein